MEQSSLVQPSTDPLQGLGHLVLELVGSHLVLEMVLALAKGDLHVLSSVARHLKVGRQSKIEANVPTRDEPINRLTRFNPFSIIGNRPIINA